MSKAALSVKWFAIYVMGLGATLILAPNLILGLFGVPATTEVWIRVAGVLAFNLGMLNYVAAPLDFRPHQLATIAARCLVLVCFIAFAMLDMVKPVIILFGAVDVAGAVWTWLAMRADGQAQAVPV